MKIIFLDVDGVLNNFASLAEHIHLLPEKCLLVRRLCKITDAKIVLSSTWRMFMKSPDCPLLFAFDKAGLPRKLIVGATDTLKGGRGKQIDRWLVGQNVESYVIIDDDMHDFSPAHIQRMVRTRMETGLTENGVEKAASLLNAATLVPVSQHGTTWRQGFDLIEEDFQIVGEAGK